MYPKIHTETKAPMYLPAELEGKKANETCHAIESRGQK